MFISVSDLNTDRLHNYIDIYTKNFDNRWEQNKVIWQMVKLFQENWHSPNEYDETQLDDFVSMLEASLSTMDTCFSKELCPLLVPTSNQNSHLLKLARKEPGQIHQSFAKLFNPATTYNKLGECNPAATYSKLGERIEAFRQSIFKFKSGIIEDNFSKNIISAYLWLGEPEKYYLYKRNMPYLFFKAVYKGILDIDLITNIDFYNYSFNKINEFILKNSNLKEIFDNKIYSECYDDRNLKILTSDFIFYIGYKIWINNNKSRKITQYNESYFSIDTPDEHRSSTALSRKEQQEPAEELSPYTRDDFLSEVYISGETYDDLLYLLDRKKNLILQGPPGTGKTFAARRLAWAMLGEKNNDHIRLIQFHQSYSYEDFIAGYKPTESGFELKTGIFYNFCKEAEKDPDGKYFLLIDEINRGNLSKIFGELLMLIEKDYRGTSLTLPFTVESIDPIFSVPENLFIIGTMNTADRSLAMLDFALRRRFSFVTMEPGFASDGFRAYQAGLHNPRFNQLVDRIALINREIASERSLGHGFCIGHSYLCNLQGDCTDERLDDIIEYDLLPLLEEYCFDSPATLAKWQGILQKTADGQPAEQSDGRE